MKPPAASVVAPPAGFPAWKRKLRRATRRWLGPRWLSLPPVRAVLGLEGDEGGWCDCIGPWKLAYSLDSIVGQLLFDRGTFERDETALIGARLDCAGPDAVMLDVGANLGWHSLNAARRPGVARIYAFEPAASTRGFLERNVRRNPAGRKIEVVPVALADRSGTATFSFCADDAYSSLAPDDRRPVACEYPVRVLRLDDWVAAAGLTRIDFVKLDVEGAEPAVIAGAAVTLRRFRPELLVEVYQGTRRDYSATGLIEAIRALGYDAFVLVDGGEVPYREHDDAWFNYHFVPREAAGGR
jgi:FkbM family methyltransferase